MVCNIILYNIMLCLYYIMFIIYIVGRYLLGMLINILMVII